MPDDIFLTIKSGSKIYQINESEIIYVESLKDFIQVHLKGGKKMLVKYRISQIESELSTNFIRVHKSFIVNRKSITALVSNSVELGSIAVPMGGSYRPLVEGIFRK